MFKKLLTILSAIIILTFGTAFAGVEINDQRGLVGSWDLSQESYNPSTRRLTDNSGPGNHGTSTNIANFTADRHGHANKAMTFNGSSDYVDCGNDESLDITDEITIEAWVKRNVISGRQNIMAMGVAYNQNSIRPYFDGNNSRLLIYSGGVIQASPLSVSLGWSVGEWHHVVVTVKTNEAKIYLDGVDSATDTSITMPSELLATKIGRDVSGAHYFNGSIDEVRIYNRALSPAEILDRYQTGARKLKIDPGSPGVILLNMKASDDYYIRKAA